MTSSHRRKTHKMRRFSASEQRRVLVVDDSASTRQAMRARLEQMGHVVTLAASGEEAFALCMEQPFDLLVSDVTMGAISGVHLCRMLRAEPATQELPIVLLTADDGPRSRFWGTHAGCDAYVSKREPETLAGAVSRALTARGGSRPERAPRHRIDPLERLSRVLDAHLLQAVVDREARSLMTYVDDRQGLLQGALRLFDEVLACPYAVLRIDGSAGRPGRSSALLARGPWPAEPDRRALLSVGFAPTAPPTALLQAETSFEGTPDPGDASIEPILAGRELIGQLRLYGGRRGIGRDDRETAVWLAAALGPVLKSMLLVEETRHLATTDSLTGLRNRRTITERLRDEIARSTRYGTSVSVLLCDIDHFKQVNDTFGHQTGDDVLRAVSHTFERAVREVDLIGRWGGEEFLVVLPETDSEGAEVVAERIRAYVAELPPFSNGPAQVTISVGVAHYEIGDELEQLVRRADKAMYRAKHEGRNRVHTAAKHA